MRIPFFGIAIACLLAVMPQVANAKDPVIPDFTDPIFPKLTGPVVDLVDEIPADQEAKLSADIREFQKQTGHQLQILTVPDLQGVPIEDYGVKLGRHWKIGREGVNDGIILIHAINERKTRIEVGYGAEPYLTDGMSSLITHQIIIPAFKEGRFADGIVDGAAAIMREAAITPEQRAIDEKKAKEAAERRSQAIWNGFLNLLTYLFMIAATIASGLGIWRFSTRKERARIKEEARLAEEARRLAYAEQQRRIQQAQRERAEREAEERARQERERREEETRLRKQREDMLAAMSIPDRKAFLAEEERQRAEERRIQEAAAARRREEERQAEIARAAQRERDRAEEERRARDRRDEEARTAAITTSWTSSSNTSSSSSSSTSDWSGGGGDFGGGGATGDY